MKKKLLLLETEMRGPGGHYLDNLIESFFFFKNDFDIYAVLNRKFDPEGTFIPKELNFIFLFKKIYSFNNLNSIFSLQKEFSKLLNCSYV